MIIVTAPHARCWAESGEPTKCDRLALLASKQIAEGLPHDRPMVLLLPKGVRRECDLNRFACRDRPYRRFLSFLARQCAQLVVDVHSFEPHRGRIGSVAGDRPLVILSHPETARSSLVTKFRQNIAKATNYIPDVILSSLGDIRSEMNENRIPVLSLEFNARLPTRQLLFFTSAISRYLSDFTPNE